MPLERPAPLAERTTGPPSAPRAAATVLLLRDGEPGLEVLLVQRSPAQRFLGGVWVFPGGAVEPGDGRGEAGLRAAALRELEEEVGVRLSGPGALVALSRWITPQELRIRFDTRFYLAALPAGAQARVDGGECVEHAWWRPADALAREDLGLLLPTVAHLERVRLLPSVAAALAGPWEDAPVPVEPRIVGGCETARVVLPGQPEGHL